ncbi:MULTISPECIES: LysR family transcriptional regulator [unclassified Bradyrhizobium]|jgi:DNA-binding transcriptional LysR family regulator|uniref:LysR family transcriptional regulator n=1 Tax=unclassified Bradyrhizobium TaxID=2631580 RepID=UPI001FF7E9EE|nr:MULTISPECIES: LysR family transcriptional regulator [unclassified Bradyrhizobium]MCK1677515.1 LysR family transcriptional regulator [Bradyrhizobium sp. 150]MCK1700697.1 LysR family transcriptional regulator [Bradyrhizobium sp. 146]UPK11177.1 LysR family transcriptional regulator [Bradyrhizobium sp. 155]
MNRDNASDLVAFLAVARERNFTRAAAKLGMTQSALSQIVRNLEERLGVRLLNRTTRSVTPTQAGERLFLNVGPKFTEMDAELAALGELREKPAGTIRVTAGEYAASAILFPALSRLLPQYPDIHVEVIVDYGLTNIVAQQVDAGIRPGELVAKDMIAVRVSPDLRMAVVGSPSYFADRKRPKTPQDLTQHNCLNLRLPTHGGSLYAWEFQKNERELNVRVDGQLVFNSAGLLLDGAMKGLGLAYLTEGQVQPHVSEGRLVRVLADWCPPFPGYHLYYPSRRQPSPAFSLIVDALRYRSR